MKGPSNPTARNEKCGQSINHVDFMVANKLRDGVGPISLYKAKTLHPLQPSSILKLQKWENHKAPN